MRRLVAVLVLVVASLAGGVGITAGATLGHHSLAHVTRLAGDINPPAPDSSISPGG